MSILEDDFPRKKFSSKQSSPDISDLMRTLEEKATTPEYQRFREKVENDLSLVNEQLEQLQEKLTNCQEMLDNATFGLKSNKVDNILMSVVKELWESERRKNELGIFRRDGKELTPSDLDSIRKLLIEELKVDADISMTFRQGKRTYTIVTLNNLRGQTAELVVLRAQTKLHKSKFNISKNMTRAERQMLKKTTERMNETAQVRGSRFYWSFKNRILVQHEKLNLVHV